MRRSAGETLSGRRGTRTAPLLTESKGGTKMATSSTARKTETTTTPAKLLTNGALLRADRALPGASLLAEGEVKSAALHIISSLADGAVFGPLGSLAGGADSYSRSVTGKHLHEHYFNVDVNVRKAND